MGARSSQIQSDDEPKKKEAGLDMWKLAVRKSKVLNKEAEEKTEESSVKFEPLTPRARSFSDSSSVVSPGRGENVFH